MGRSGNAAEGPVWLKQTQPCQVAATRPLHDVELSRCRWMASALGEEPPPPNDLICCAEVESCQGGPEGVVELLLKDDDLSRGVLLQPLAYRGTGTRQDA